MNRTEQLYFFWLVGFVCHNDEIRSYRKVLEALYSKEFRWLLEMDENLAGNGIHMRYRYADEKPGVNDDILDDDRPCNVLEMMVALAISMEYIMQNSLFGDRTDEWFWEMMDNLGLSYYDDKHFDDKKVDDILEIFLDRKYKNGGKGNLFCYKSCYKSEEIWKQATNWLSKKAKKNGEIW